MTSRIRHFAYLLGAAALVVGCARSSDEIGTAYVSPLTYQDWDCDQISMEMQRVTTRASQLGGQIDENASDDAVAMGVGAVLFWPALFFIDGDGPEAHEYARLKGEADALHQASISKKCGMEGTTAVASRSEPAARSTETVSVATGVTQQVTAAAAAPVASQWRGEGQRDGCGRPYSVDLTIDQNRQVKGKLQRDGAAYLVGGKVDPAGKLDNSAALSDPSASAAKYVNLKLDFSGPMATGGYSTFDGKAFDCTTVVTLQRVTS